MNVAALLYRDSDLEKYKNNSVPSGLGCKGFTTIMLPKNCYNTKHNPLTASVTCMYRIYRHVYDFYLI